MGPYLEVSFSLTLWRALDHELYRTVDPALRQEQQHFVHIPHLVANAHSSKKDSVQEIWEGNQ